ncbi:helix-turn-helix transcriptional regulator [Algoriphagus aquimarinus]|uniref:helix-turn-helix domain-containing protein n=1 Tax=Algoriphagus aquimarinus TaxID=237018 RepID=UPI0030D8F919|tara:strand:+ start:13604 stop:14110 length:507 start_codon:yes stop_codon:yes gene_type:complete
MIKNFKQKSITINKLREFQDALKQLEANSVNDSLNEIMMDSIKSQIETFNVELDEFERLKRNRPQIVEFKISEFPESLIKARIASGISQKELALKANLKEQQIQRYEATNYESANFERLVSIADSIGVSFESSRLFINKNEIVLQDYSPDFVRKATQKLQSRKSIFVV